MNVIDYGKLWIKTAKDRFDGWWTQKQLGLLKNSIVAKAIKLIKNLHKSFMDTTMKNMNPAAKARINQLMDGKEVKDVYSSKNIAKTNVEGKYSKPKDMAKTADSAKDSIGSTAKTVLTGPGGTMPRQNVNELLKAATDKNVDPMAMTQSGIGEIGKVAEKGRG